MEACLHPDSGISEENHHRNVNGLCRKPRSHTSGYFSDLTNFKTVLRHIR